MQQLASGKAEVFLSSCQHQGSPAPSALLCCDVAEKEAGLSVLPDMQTREGNDRLTASHSPPLAIAYCVSASHPASLVPCDIPFSMSAGFPAFLSLIPLFLISSSVS